MNRLLLHCNRIIRLSNRSLSTTSKSAPRISQRESADLRHWLSKQLGLASTGCTIELPRLLALLSQRFPEVDAHSLVETASDVFRVSGNHVALSPSNLHTEFMSVMRHVASLPDEGVDFADFPLVVTRGIEWLGLFNDVVEVDSERRRIVPIRTQQNKFTKALRRVILQAPPTGLDVEALIDALEKVMDSDEVDPTAHGFAQLAHALLEVDDIHYVRNDKIVPVNWADVVHRVSQRLPPEGVLEHGFQRLLYREVPDFRGASLSIPLSQWIEKRFSSYIEVCPSVTTRTSNIYRRKKWLFGVMRDSEPSLGPSCFQYDVASAIHALRQAGYSDPEKFIDFEDVKPLIRSLPISYGGTSWLALLRRAASSIDFEVRVMAKAKSGNSEVCVFVDGTTLSPSASSKLFAALQLSGPDIVLHRVARRARDPVHTDSDCIVSDWLSVTDVLHAAVIQSMPADASAPTVFSSVEGPVSAIYFLFGDGQWDAFEELTGTLGLADVCDVVLASPSSVKRCSKTAAASTAEHDVFASFLQSALAGTSNDSKGERPSTSRTE